jgi:hypothetical protein
MQRAVIYTDIAQLGERETETMILSPYSIHGFWGARRETPQAIAVRSNRLVDQLAPLHPAFGNWIWCGRNEAPIAFAAIRDRLAENIAAAVSRGDDDEPEPIGGFRFATLNSLKTTPRSVGTMIHAGSWIQDSHYSNTADLHTTWKMAPDPTIVAYRVFKAALVAFAECFETTYCVALPDDLKEFWPQKKFRFGWINYVAPRFAPLITPPKSVIVEHRPNGGLLMAATDETFMTSNPRHLAAARDIETALAPLNALPWPLDAEPEHGSKNA